MGGQVADGGGGGERGAGAGQAGAGAEAPTVVEVVHALDGEVRQRLRHELQLGTVHGLLLPVGEVFVK